MTTPGGCVDERDVVVAAGGRVEREGEQSVGGDRDVDGADHAVAGTPGIMGGVLNVTKFLLAISVVSKLSGRRSGRAGELDGLEAADDRAVAALNDWSGKPKSLKV